MPLRKSLRAAEDVRPYRAEVGRDVLGAPPSTCCLFLNLPCEAASSLARRIFARSEPFVGRRLSAQPTHYATRIGDFGIIGVIPIPLGVPYVRADAL